VDDNNQAEEPPAMKTIMIGLDLAKNVFQVHGIGEAGEVVIRRRLRRGQVLGFFAKLAPAMVGMEACGGAHYWARELKALGHEVRMMPPCYVKPYVKRNKTDGRDAEAICEAMQRPTMRFVAVKSAEQQAVSIVHGTRAMLVRTSTQLANCLRAAFAEFGVVAGQGAKGLRQLLAQLEDLPQPAAAALKRMADYWLALARDIKELELKIVRATREDEAARRLMGIPGIGPLTASAVLAGVADMRQFRSARGFAAWLGLTPRQNNSGNKHRSGSISKQGQRHLRSLLVLGASSHLRQERNRKDKQNPWLARRPTKVAVVALAAKNARIIWALLAKNEHYRAPARLAA
jgi:transposase